MHFLQVLPVAFVMIAGPQVVTSFSLATGQRFIANSTAYVAGAAVSEGRPAADPRLDEPALVDRE